MYVAACFIVPKEPFPGAARKCIDLGSRTGEAATIVIGFVLLALGLALVIGGTSFWKGLVIISGAALIVAGVLLVVHAAKGLQR